MFPQINAFDEEGAVLGEALADGAAECRRFEIIGLRAHFDVLEIDVAGRSKSGCRTI